MSDGENAADARQTSALDEIRLANTALRNVLVESSTTDQAFGVSLRGAVRTLESCLSQHEELSESPGGDLEAILEEKPGLAPMLQRQRDEHRDMNSRANHIETLVDEQLAFDRLDVDMLRLEAQVLCDIVELHVARAADLLYEALYTVEGGEQG